MGTEDFPPDDASQSEPPLEPIHWRPMEVPKTEEEERKEARFRHPAMQDDPNYNENPPENQQVYDE